MVVRPFDWRDILALHRLQEHTVFLDNALLLTRGPFVVRDTLFSYLAPNTGIFTCVVETDRQTQHSSAIGQLSHRVGTQLAHLTFITPAEALASQGGLALLDYLVQLSGRQGALRLLADVDEENEAFETLRRCGFAIYSRQRVWRLSGALPTTVQCSSWRLARSQDAIAIRNLYSNLVPGLVQQAEPFVNQPPRGMVYDQDNELLAYVELKYGQRGIWVQPFVHPDTQDIVNRLVDLFQQIPNRLSRPIYVCIRSYQAWLEAAVEELGAEASPRQAVMAKHLAVSQKALRPYALRTLEGGQPEITAPIAHWESR